MKKTKQADVIVEVDVRDVTPALFAALQPMWIRLGTFVLPVIALACAFRLLGGGRDRAIPAALVAIAFGGAYRIARHLAASRARSRALDHRERVTLGPDALVRDGVRIAWNEVTDAAEIDTVHPEREAIRVLALRTQGTWCVLTPLARFKRGDYDAARAIVNAARNVRVVTV